MGAEKVIENQIKAFLDKRPYCWYMKVHGNRYQKIGVPDLIICDAGRFISIEIKKPGEKPTAIQEQRLKEIASAGGLTTWVTSLDEVKAILGPPARGLKRGKT